MDDTDRNDHLIFSYRDISPENNAQQTRLLDDGKDPAGGATPK